MITLRLLLLPGVGMTTVSVREGTSLADFMATRDDLRGRSILVQGQVVPPERWATVRLSAGIELAALQQAKGA